MLIQKRTVIIFSSSQDVGGEKSDGLAERLACGKHTMHIFVGFIIMWLIPLPVIYLIEAFLCSLVELWFYWLWYASPQSLYPQPGTFTMTLKTTVSSTVYARVLPFHACEMVATARRLYLTLKEDMLAYHCSFSFLADLSLHALLWLFLNLFLQLKSLVPPLYPLRETRVCVL